MFKKLDARHVVVAVIVIAVAYYVYKNYLKK